jgi:diamine N-acetyltransferase
MEEEIESAHHYFGQPVISIVGAEVALGPLNRDYLPLYYRWINDFEVTRTLDIAFQPQSWLAVEEWYARLAKSSNDVAFIIFQRATMRPIGNTGLHFLDYTQGTAEFDILIGDKECWGKGYGTEVTTLMLDYAFTGLGLQSIMLRVHDYNERGIRAYKRAGFRVIGRWRQANRLGNRAYDIVLMDCVASEFQSAVVRRLLPKAS